MSIKRRIRQFKHAGHCDEQQRNHRGRSTRRKEVEPRMAQRGLRLQSIAKGRVLASRWILCASAPLWFDFLFLTTETQRHRENTEKARQKTTTGPFASCRP